MKKLSLRELKRITKCYIAGDMSSDEIFKWAAKVHWQHAGGELKFTGGDKREMLDFIFTLMDQNDERFADSKEVLLKKINDIKRTSKGSKFNWLLFVSILLLIILFSSRAFIISVERSMSKDYMIGLIFGWVISQIVIALILYLIVDWIYRRLKPTK